MKENFHATGSVPRPRNEPIWAIHCTIVCKYQIAARYSKNHRSCLSHFAIVYTDHLETVRIF